MEEIAKKRPKQPETAKKRSSLPKSQRVADKNRLDYYNRKLIGMKTNNRTSVASYKSTPR